MDRELFIDILIAISVIIGLFLVIFAICFPILYYSSCRQAEIYNNNNQTEYTCSDFFWANEQINQKTQTIRLEQ